MKRSIRRALAAAVLALALPASLAGCGSQEISGFRVLDTVGARSYGLIYRLDDRLAPVVDAAMASLEEDGTLSAISLKNRSAAAQEDQTPAPTAEAGPEGDDEGEAGLGEDAGAPAASPGYGIGLEPGAGLTQRRLIFGVEQDFVPMAYEDNGVLRGMSVELGTALGEALGWEVAFQPIAPGEVETQLASGNIDCALGFDPASVREGRCTLGVSYMESDVVVAVRSGSELRRLRDIRGQRVGTIEDPVIVSLLRTSEKVNRYATGATVYLSLQRCLNALDYGWCAAVALDRLMLDYLR